jgi:alpha-tubulin suppressor-like RCC1 family protein
MRMIAGAVALLFGLLAAGCNGEVVGGGHRPAAVLVVSGDLQTGTVGQELPQPLVVKVVDEAGRPVRDQLVNFRVAAGGGSVFAGSAITNREGIAQERWTLGTVAGDTQQVEARAVDPETGAGQVFATFRAVAQPGPAAQLEVLPPAPSSGRAGLPLADSVAVRARDQYGNPVAGATVWWAATSGGGSVSPATSVSRADGTARAAWTLGPSLGAQTARASLAGQGHADFTANADPGIAAAIDMGPPLHFTSLYQTITIPVQARDAFGNSVAAPVTLVSLDASIIDLGPGPPPIAISKKNGSTRIVGTLFNGVTDTLEVVVQQVPASLLVRPPVSNLVVGESATFTATVSDARGVAIQGAAVSYASSAPGVASIQGATATAHAVGTAQITGTAGPGVQHAVAVEVYNAFSAQSVDAGYETTCAISDGTTYCWGSNHRGRLGTGSTADDVLLPAPVTGGHTFTQLAVGSVSGNAICGLTAAGAAYCWGTLNEEPISAPTAVPGGLAFSRLAVGSNVVCGVTTGSDVYCWGSGEYGRLGNGDTVTSAVPVRVASSVPFQDVAVGWRHACAVGTNGTVYCWGASHEGETGAIEGPCFGERGFPCHATPQAVGGRTDFREVAAGFMSTCALTAGGAAYCWGSNNSGQLGIDRGIGAREVPTAVTGGHTFASLSEGYYHFCALKSGGEAYCWGSGIPAGLPDTYAAPGRAAPGLTFTSVSGGAQHSCGVAAGGGVYCWGSQRSGEMGDGYPGPPAGTNGRINPVRVRYR